MTSLRRLKHISKKMSFLWRLKNITRKYFWCFKNTSQKWFRGISVGLLQYLIKQIWDRQKHSRNETFCESSAQISIKSAQWADIYMRVLASQGSSKPNSKCIIYYFQWFFSTDKSIYNLLSLWTVLTLAKLQKFSRSYIKSCVRFAIDIWSTFLITMLLFS